MAGVKKSQIRQVQWGAEYLWELRFPAAPSPFNQWFPATDVEENLWNLEEKQFELFMNTYGIPAGTSLLDLKVTFNDDVYHTIRRWLTQWVNTEILNNNRGITPVGNCCKLVQLSKMNFQKQPISTSSYWVVPKGSMYYTGSSQSNVLNSMVEFTIVGNAGSTTSNISSVGSSLFDTVRNLF